MVPKPYLIAPSAVACLLLAQCAPAPVTRTTFPSTVEVRAQDYSFTAPDSVAAGVVTFRFTNAGPDVHHLVIAPLPEGKSASDMVRDTSFLPTWTTMIGGPSVVTNGVVGVTRVTLAPGRYVIFCVIPTATDHKQHKALGMAKELVAVATPTPAVEEIAATTTVILSDYDFAFSTPLTRGPAEVEVINEGKQPHEIEFVQLHEGVTMEEAFRWRRTDTLPAPYTLVGGMSPLAPGRRGRLAIDLLPGHYVLVCYIPDATDGRPHVAHGMRTEFTIE